MRVDDEKIELKNLGNRLKNARLERDDSQKKFAFRLGISIPTLHKMENGHPNVAIGTWIKALAVLGKLNELDGLIAPRQSLAARFASFKKTGSRMRASKGK